jgi:hypothetical protein
VFNDGVVMYGQVPQALGLVIYTVFYLCLTMPSLGSICSV